MKRTCKHGSIMPRSFVHARSGERFADHLPMIPFKSMFRVPGQQLLARHWIGFSPEGERLEQDFDAVAIGQLAHRAEHGRAVAFAGLERPQAVDLDRARRMKDELDPAANFLLGVHERVGTLADSGGDGG